MKADYVRYFDWYRVRDARIMFRQRMARTVRGGETVARRQARFLMSEVDA